MIINIDKKNDYLNKTELIKMADIMSDAFVNHSNFIYTINKEKKRKKALNFIFLMIYKIINRYGYIHIVKEKDEIIGYITFLDCSDKDQISLKRILHTRGLLLAIKFLILLNFSGIIKLAKYIKTYNSYQKKEKKEFKILLHSTGVKLRYKGKGLMGIAIRDTYQYFKELGYKEIVLDTADPINIPIYQKLGFEVIKNIRTKDNLQTICFMSKAL